MNELQTFLLEVGKEFFELPKSELVRFTDDLESDTFVNDIETCPPAFVLSCCMDRQVNANRAWTICWRPRAIWSPSWTHWWRP